MHFHPTRSLLQEYTERITLDIHNRATDFRPHMVGSYQTTRAGLGRAGIGLERAGHRVMSIAFNGNIASVSIVAVEDRWMDAVNMAVRGSTVTARG
jgi:hypothetical protein